MFQRFSFICHGATAATWQAAFPADEPLSESALLDAATLRERLRRVDRALVSPELRARQTAAALSLEADVEPALRDLDHGRWTGRSLADVDATEPGAIQAWIDDPEIAPHGGEAISDLLQRVAAWMRNESGETRHTVIVTHASVIRAAVLHILGAPPHSFWLVDVEPLSTNEFRSDGRRWALRGLNRWQAREGRFG